LKKNLVAKVVAGHRITILKKFVRFFNLKWETS